GSSQTRLVRRGLRGPAAPFGRIYRAVDGSLRKARHARHMVRARLGRVPPRSARAQSETGQGRQGDARECRKLAGGSMCPSYRVTREERDVTRGRANTLRLAISGQLGPNALASDEMVETLKLCVSCKACRHECPTGVDMAKMKIEVLAARAASRGLSLRDRLVGYLPHYAPLAARFAWLAN